MNNRQFETLVQMIAQLSDRIEEVHKTVGGRIGTLESDLRSFKRQTQKNFQDQSAMLQEIASYLDVIPAATKP